MQEEKQREPPIATGNLTDPHAVEITPVELVGTTTVAYNRVVIEFTVGL